jgi:hypothetical protein
MSPRPRRSKQTPVSRFNVGDTVQINDVYRKLVKRPDGQPSRLEGQIGTIKEVVFTGGYEVDFGIPTPKYGRTPPSPTWLMRDEQLDPA